MTVEEVLIQGLCEFPCILPTAGEGNVSTGVCHSVHGGVFTGGGPQGGVSPLDRDPLWTETPVWTEIPLDRDPLIQVSAIPRMDHCS